MPRRSIERSTPAEGNVIDLKTQKRVEIPAIPIICEQIRRFREKAGIEQKAMAKTIGVTPNAVSNWENGRSRPDINLIPGKTSVSNGLVCLIGLATYVILLFATYFGLHRPVTTELLLITGWAMLEVCCVNTCRAGGALSVPQSIWMLLVIAAAFVISMVLYVLYYRMEEWRAFYAAMVPLITEAVSMGIFELVLRL